ncbi:MAG: ABC transporter permease [Aggregatilineales bacterium]
MTKAWLVAKREYLTNLRRPAFLIAAFGAPLFSVVFMLLVFNVLIGALLEEDSLGRVGFVDLSGVLADAVGAPDNFVRLTDKAEAQTALNSGAVGVYFVVAANYMSTGVVTVYSPSRVPESVTDAIDRFLLANVRHQHGDHEVFNRISNPVEMVVHLKDNGRTLDQSAAGGLFLLPAIFALVFFIAIQTSSGYLMSGVVEEKTSRVIEILVTSVKPLELLLGKVVGLGLLGLTQMLVWLTAIVLFVTFGGEVDFLQGVTVPADLIAVTLLYFFLSYAMYAGLLGAVGAVANSEQESRQLAGMISLLGVVPFFFITVFIFSPQSPLVIALTLIPFTAPLSVILRMSLSTVPAWQLVASVLILVVTMALTLWGGARVFRWSLLMYGKQPGLRDLWRVARGQTSARMGTATAKEQSA